MWIRHSIFILAALLAAGCSALSAGISDEMAPQISTEVAMQVGTAVVGQVGTAVANQSTLGIADRAAADSLAETGKEEIALVTRVIDGDTIDVRLNGKTERIRYVQINTPERADPCFAESTRANADLVAGKTVRLLHSKKLTDPFGRLLHYVYVGDIMVERVLVEQGWAEVVLYPPNDMHYEEFVRLEAEAAAAGRGCHPTGIFDDGSTTR
jgi:endonuclease YncB( thermonuclease family)